MRINRKKDQTSIIIEMVESLDEVGFDIVTEVLKRNQSQHFGVMRLKELIQTNHVHL